MITITTVVAGSTISKTQSGENTTVMAVDRTRLRAIPTIETKGTTFNISWKQRIRSYRPLAYEGFGVNGHDHFRLS